MVTPILLIPVILAVGGLLFYNYIRFSNFFDFGYVTINSAEWLMESVQTYGMFNIHFLPVNLNMMFLRFPQIALQESCLSYSPTREGVSHTSHDACINFYFPAVLKSIIGQSVLGFTPSLTMILAFFTTTPVPGNWDTAI